MEHWIIFSSIAFIATVTPGPAVLLVTSHSMQYGIVRSIATICGNVSGLLLMSIFSFAGLSALILASSTAFHAIKIAGAVYLIYLGIKLWRNGLKNSDRTIQDNLTSRPVSLYCQGVLIALTNPKAIIFTTALFPQFISINEPLTMQFIVLVTTLIVLSFSCLLSYSVIAAKVKRRSTGILDNSWLCKLLGSALVISGVVLASTER